MERTRNILWALFLFCTFVVQAQIVPQRQDTARVIVTDTTVVIQSDSVTITTEEVVTTSRQATIVTQAADTLLIPTTSDAFFAPQSIFKPSPKKAVLYSAIFPGLGQVYNRKYWKLPIVYGGFIGFSYAITWNHGYYKLYFDAYRSIIDEDPNTNDWHDAVPYGRDPNTIDKTWFTGVLKDRKDYYRYYRDFSIIGAVALYGLAIVDAYVDAQLFDFDMSPDLSMRVTPTIMNKNNNASFLADSYGVQFSFTF